MRLKNITVSSDFKIILVDDEQGIVDSLSVLLRKSGYLYEGFTNPIEAIERIKNSSFDLLILDYLMESIHGDEVVRKIREFNSEIYILLLTGHKDLAPPIETLKSLDIQGYCEKSDRFDQLHMLIESAQKSVQLLRKNKRFEEGLNKILEAVPKIYQLLPIGVILKDILNGILPFVKSENAFILIDDLRSAENEGIYRGIGKYDVTIDEFFNILDPELMEQLGTVRMNKSYLRLPNGIIMPLILDGEKTLGIIYIESNDIDDSIKLLSIYTTQVALSISNAFMHSLVNMKNSELSKTYEELRTRYLDTIEVLRLTVDAKDVYTRGHSDRVAYFAVKLGKALGLSFEEIELLSISGIFHDIGKIGTTDDILLKNERLNKDEYEEIKKHPLKGAYILSVVSMFQNAVPVIKCHHERIDGKGYPEGLIGDDIPYLARVLSVVDAFDAMTSNRVYRTKLSLDEAKAQLLSGKGTQFDEHIVDVFIKLLDDFDNMQKDLAYTFT